MTTETNGPGPYDLRWQSSAIQALQEATEAYLVHLFEDAYVNPWSRPFIVRSRYLQKSVRNTRKTCHHYAKRHPVGTPHTRSVGWHGVNDLPLYQYPSRHIPFRTILLMHAIPFS